VDDMDEEEKGFELAVAKSLVEIQKLEAQKQSQQQLLAEHFKNTMAITDANFGKLYFRYFFQTFPPSSCFLFLCLFLSVSLSLPSLFFCYFLCV
jgi:hypothetical protein